MLDSIRSIYVIALALLSASSVVLAQVSEKQTLTLDGAKAVLDACEREARSKSATGVIAVVDDGGNLVAVHRIDGTFAAGANISIGKARTAAMFKRPTKFFEDLIRNGRTAMVALPDFTPLQGGVPIVVDGQVVGAVGVSGAASAQQDEEIAIAGANAIAAGASPMPGIPFAGNAASAESAAGVAYFDRAQVLEAFEHGKPLFSGSTQVNCAVNPSRRTAPGEAEVHIHETDVMYIQEGAATLVTGGSMVDPREVLSGEVRGAAIEGGELRALTKGDVIIIPRGVPHWFKQVEGTLLYYVVKVRS